MRSSSKFWNFLIFWWQVSLKGVQREEPRFYLTSQLACHSWFHDCMLSCAAARDDSYSASTSRDKKRFRIHRSEWEGQMWMMVLTECLGRSCSTSQCSLLVFFVFSKCFNTHAFIIVFVSRLKKGKKSGLGSVRHNIEILRGKYNQFSYSAAYPQNIMYLGTRENLFSNNK